MAWSTRKYLRQKSKVKWFQEGDYNGIYFHIILRDRRRRLHIHKVKNHRNRRVQGDDKIVKVIVKHFETLFNMNNSLFSCIPRIISTEENGYLTAIPYINKMREVVFNLSAHNATGPDDFNEIFFQTCWEIIKKSIATLIQAFFN